MIIHLIKHETGAVSSSNWPFKENDIESTPYEVTEEQNRQVLAGEKDWAILDGVATLKEPAYKQQLAEEQKAQEQLAIAEKSRKLQLIQKVTSGTATLAEQEEFANLL